MSSHPSPAPGRYRNPILPGCHPDPSICRVDDVHYLVTSTFEHLPGLPVHRSTNLVDWEPIGHAVHRPEQLDLTGLPSSKGLYAPTIRHHDGVFHVVCTVVAPVGGADVRTGHFLVTATDPAGPWSDPIWFDGFTGIDPSLTFAPDGRVWLCGTRMADPGRWNGEGEIWLTELDAASFSPIGETHLLWHGALNGAGWAEGPHLVAHPDGGWMLVAAEGGTNRDHGVCIAYAEEITGPYTGDPGNPRLTHRHLGDRAPIADVGHADLVEAPDGRWWATVLAVQTDGAGGNALMGRQTHLVPVEWERGRPLFAPGIGRVEPEMQAPGVPDQAPWPTQWHDDFDGAALDLCWTAPRRHPQQFVDLAARPGWARITASPTEPGEVGPFAFLGRRLPVARVRATAVIEPHGDVRAGIVLRTSEAAHLEVGVAADGTARLVLSDRGETTVLATATVPPGGPLEIELVIDGLHAEARVADAPLGAAPLHPLATGPASMFLGSWVGVFATGAGHVDVDAIRLAQLL